MIVNFNCRPVQSVQGRLVHFRLIENVPVEVPCLLFLLHFRDGLLVGVDHGVVKAVGAGLRSYEGNVPAVEFQDARG